MKGFTKLEFVLKLDADDMYHAERIMEDIIEEMKIVLKKEEYEGEVATTCMDATSFEEWEDGEESYL